ncbi:MAG TPA: hypothetical protein DCQ64_09625 [Candidatus Rokubacteria bacterium]|nr:hypothetical protein [Candidatus Rokubacteria bacterium]
MRGPLCPWPALDRPAAGGDGGRAVARARPRDTGARRWTGRAGPGDGRPREPAPRAPRRHLRLRAPGRRRTLAPGGGRGYARPGRGVAGRDGSSHVAERGWMTQKEVLDQLRTIVVERLRFDTTRAAEMTLATTLPKGVEGSLGLDSLDFIELSVAMEERFGFIIDEGQDLSEEFHSLDSLSRFILAKMGQA